MYIGISKSNSSGGPIDTYVPISIGPPLVYILIIDWLASYNSFSIYLYAKQIGFKAFYTYNIMFYNK